MLRFLFILFCSGLFIAVTPVKIAAQKAITIKVVDKERKPITDAKITLMDSDLENAVEARSDANGMVTFNNISLAKYKNGATLHVEKEYANVSFGISLENSTTPVTIVAPIVMNISKDDKQVIFDWGNDPKKDVPQKKELLGPTENVNVLKKPPLTNTIVWGPYSPSCDFNPILAVPEFSSIAVVGEKTLSDAISSSCFGAAEEAVNSLVAVTEHAISISSQVKFAWNQIYQQRDPKALATMQKLEDDVNANTKKLMEDAFEKTSALLENVKKLTVGPELYVVSCLWDGMKQYAIPESIAKLKTATGAIGKAKQALQEKVSAIRNRIASGKRPEWADKDLFTNWEDVTKNLDKSTDGLSMLLAYVSDPKTILPNEQQADLAISAAEAMLGSLIGNCQIREVERQISVATSAAQEALTATRLFAAQNKKEESKWRKLINDFVSKNYPPADRGWEHMDPSDPRLNAISDKWGTWAKYHNTAINEDRHAKAIEQKLVKISDLCSKLQSASITINDRVEKFRLRWMDGLKYINECKVKEAEGIVRELSNLENSACQHFFPKALDKTLGEDLAERIIKAKAKCNEPPVKGNWTLVSVTVNPPDPDKVWGDKPWTYSAQSTSASLRIYNGDKMEFQWTAPPQQITSNGFTISLSSQVKTVPNSRQVGALIGVEGYGLTSDIPADQRRAYAYSGDIAGVSSSAQKSVTFKPVANASEIEVRVGMQYNVTFTYKYKRAQ